jgi:hypothetical protein
MNIINPERYASQTDVEIFEDIEVSTRVSVRRAISTLSIKEKRLTQNKKELMVSIMDMPGSYDTLFAGVQADKQPAASEQIRPRPGWELIKRILLDMDPSLKETEPGKAREEFKKLCQEIARGLNEPWDEILRKSRGRE